jgi:hypothetical protein
LRLPGVVDDNVEGVVHLEPKLRRTRSSKPEQPGERQVSRLVGAADHVVAAGLEAQAAGKRPRKGSRAELAETISAAAIPRVTG